MLAPRARRISALTSAIFVASLSLAAPVAAEATIPTTLTLAGSPASVFVGDTITLTATVTPNPGACPVNIWGEDLTLDPATGSASTTVTALSEAHVKIYTASFGGCGDYMGHPGFAEAEVDISRRPTTSTLTSPSSVGRGDVFSVSVALTGVPEAGTLIIREVGPTGIDGILNLPIGQASVTSSPVTVNLPSMLPGDYVLRAEYQGSTEWAPSQSATKALTVVDRPTTTSITVMPDPSLWGEALDVEISVTPVPDDGGVVEVLLNGLHAAWPTMDWDDGTGTASFTPNLPGNYTVSAVFRGSAYPIPRYGESRDDEPHTVSGTPVDQDPPVGTVVVNGGADLVNDPGVTLTFEASDDSLIQKLEASNDGSTWESVGVLPALYWSLGAAGGSNAEGTRTVYARWTDQWNNVSEVASDSFTFDWVGPEGVVIIDASGNYTIDSTVILSVAATDAGSGVEAVAASNDGVNWTERSYTPSYLWTLSPGDGIKTVHVKWRDGNDHWSDESIESIVLDTAAPTATVPTFGFARGTKVTSGSTATKFTWTGSDATSGVARYEAALRTDGGAWSTISTNLLAPTVTLNLAAGHAYQLRVRGIDNAGNVGVWSLGSTFSVNAHQEGSGKFTWRGDWTRPSNGSFWGGRESASSDAGAKVTFKFTGRSLAWIGSVGPSRGSARIYVDGVLVKTVDLSAGATAYRKVVASLSWSTAVSRKVKVVVVGTAGHPRVNIDAFVTG